MKNLSVIFALFLFLSFNAAYAQSETKTEKKETKVTDVNHEKKVNVNQEESAKPWNEVCPVRGGKVQKETATVEYQDKQYGFCCPGCDSKFE
ncbi:MAG: YHS domain-containing protein, partial [Ignavibacteriales bacterium]